ncbi:MAG: NADH:ubiquinone oxidoreductase [Kouleothrix sp.]|jgi:Ni,Fe-hydrogenase III small subunit|nr:NADH:ubiquinone oxidoreductase [Kouleothrix sp.]
MIKVYRINTGSCGGCDIEIAAAVDAGPDLGWADAPATADLLLLTGPLTAASRPLVLALCHELGGRVPLLAVGRCAIDGHPFGRGGIADAPELAARTLDGCPPTPTVIAEAIRRIVADQPPPASRRG